MKPMPRVRDSLSRKLTAMNMLVSGAALLLASSAFFAYDLVTFRNNLASGTSIQAQIIGANAVSPLIFNDNQSAENTLLALRAAPHIVYGGIYTSDGVFFAGYWRDNNRVPVPLPDRAFRAIEDSWFDHGEFVHTHMIVFQDKPAGVVYLRSDLGALNQRLKTYAGILAIILIVSLLAALAVSRISQRTISQPILTLADVALQVSRDKDYGLRATAASDGDEVSLLVNAFNEMLQEIQNRDSALQEREQQFRTLADSIPQMAWMGDPNGNLFWYNQRWYEFTGTTPQEMTGWGWQSVHDPEKLPQVLREWRRSLAAGERFQMVFPLRAADGSYRDFLTLAMPVRDVNGTVVRWFGTNTDITDQRRSEEALRQSEKLAATGRLAASIAHEINNPLEVVTNLVYLSKKQPANMERYLNLAEHELERIAQITKNTLGFYRDSASRVEVDIVEILGEVIALYNRKLQFKKIELRLDYGTDVRMVGYPGELRQIFANLLANAIEALPQCGCLRIRARKRRSWSDPQTEGVRVTFVDNGMGISPVDRRRVFEPFFTTKKDVGTGLGLWLTSSLVEKHQGRITLRSSVLPGKSWTVFSVFLPSGMPGTKIAAVLGSQDNL